MKKLFILSLLAFSLSAAAQNPQNAQNTPRPVEGIWIFKIGKSPIEVTEQVAKELQTTIKLAKTSKELFTVSKPAIFELEHNTDRAKTRPSRAPFCEGNRVFYFNEYKVGNVIVLRDVYLTFKDGILIQIFSDQPSSFLPPFTSVHGTGTRATKVDSTTTNLNGKKEIVSNLKYVDQWDSGAIKAASVQKTYFDRDGQRRKEFFFEVYAQKELSDALSCENQLRAKFSGSGKNAETNKLMDLDL